MSKTKKRQYGSMFSENNKDQKIRGCKRPRRSRSDLAVNAGDGNNHPDFEKLSEFLKSAHEDVLLEIFLRLPSCRSAIVVGSVSRSWSSVIFQPEFVPRFISIHQDQPYTVLFHRAEGHLFRGAGYHQPIFKLLSKESIFLHGKEAAPSSYLDFMPSPMLIRASCNDLLLVSPAYRGNCSDYYICNPITKRWFQLPAIDLDSLLAGGILSGFALVCLPNSSNLPGPSSNAQYHYKVVLIYMPRRPKEASDAQFKVAIFCSKSGQWSQSLFSLPRYAVYRFWVDVVTCNEILYWLDGDQHAVRIVAFDLFKSHCGVICLPDDFGCGWPTVTVHLGAIGGELRLLKLFRIDEECFVMKVWKLNQRDSASTLWVLVHEINLKRPIAKEMILLSFHPTDGSVVFMIWSKDIFEYRILEDKYVKVGKYGKSIPSEDWYKAVSLVHPVWPTPVPSQ